jgi:hypothetical protein
VVRTVQEYNLWSTSLPSTSDPFGTCGRDLNFSSGEQLLRFLHPAISEVARSTAPETCDRFVFLTCWFSLRRIEVKRFRYVLEMADSDHAQRKPLIDELKLVQKTIGEWHDWMELSRIACELLQRDKGCKIVQKIKQTASLRCRRQGGTTWRDQSETSNKRNHGGRCSRVRRM